MSINLFRAPKSNITGYNPIKQERSMDEIKREVAPSGGPLTIPPLAQAPHPQPVQSVNLNPTHPAFQKLRAMFAKGQ